MESGTRKKRTLAERRESDKLRQRRFRAKKREEARLLQVISGGETDDRKERVYTVPRKTAEEIRETNRIRQQRFRAKKRETDDTTEDPLIESMETEEPAEIPTAQTPQENPVEIIQRILFQAINEEKDRQTEIRREKDRIRKRRERQRKKDSELRKAGVNQDEFQTKLDHLEMNMTQSVEQVEENLDELEDVCQDVEPMESPETLIKQEDAEDPEGEIGSGFSAANGFFDSTQFMSQLEQMSLLMKLATAVDTVPALNVGSISPEVPTTLEELGASSSSPILPQIGDETPIPEKKPWQRCSSSEERRERERMRKRMYRAKQKFISTGKLEMQWDPTPIKRTPNDDGELGITPIPEWTKNLSSEQKAAAHRIYNKRYRERIRNCVGPTDKEHSQQNESQNGILGVDSDFSNLPPEVYNEILATISQCNLSSLMSLHQND